jgi:hypothetical protein
MALQVDNSIIDFGTISNIVTTLQTHNDQFVAFESEPLLTTTDTSTNMISPLNVTSVQMAAVRLTMACGDTKPVSYGVQFSQPPIVITSIESKVDGAYVAIVQDTSADKSATSVKVVDANNSKNTTQVIVHVLAIGQK